jgi:putative membrane protein
VKNKKVNIVVGWIISTLAVLCAAYILPGVHINDFITALVVALVLGIINTFLKPLILILTLPVNLLSLGLFTLVINAFLILLATKIVPGFYVDGFWWALIFSIVLSVINSFLRNII